MSISKPYATLEIEDLRRSPVWEYLPENDCRDETWVCPVSALPVTNMSGRVIGTQLQLANGQVLWGFLGNISLCDPKKTKSFLTVSIRRTDGQWFDLARYHDVDYDRRGPADLATFLSIALDDVFPICYDISTFAVGHDEVIRGRIPAEAIERLSKEELIRLAIQE